LVNAVLNLGRKLEQAGFTAVEGWPMRRPEAVHLEGLRVDAAVARGPEVEILVDGEPVRAFAGERWRQLSAACATLNLSAAHRS
jgi:hypothetical protein